MEDAAVMDVGIDAGAEEVLDQSQETIEGEQTEGAEKVDGRVGSKAYREALKAWEAASPEHKAFATQARAEHFKLSQIAEAVPGIWDEKRGTFNLDPIKSTFALIESVGGAEALTTMQERIAETDAVDEMLAAGDPKALEALGPDFDAGLSKLTPTILERIAKSDPAGYASAILPHLMQNLNNSPLVGELNKMVDLFSDPRFAALSDADKLKSIKSGLATVGNWWAAQERKAGEVKTAPVAENPTQAQDTREQEWHWKTEITPPVVQHENSTLESLFKPYDARLKLDATAKAALMSDFKAELKRLGTADTAYMKQMALYRKSKNPDAATVQNFAKNAINRHAKAAVEKVVTARYGRFLGKKQAAPAMVSHGASNGASSTATMVSVKPDPNTVDWRRTSDSDQWAGKYTLKSGKVVQWRKPN